MKFQHLLNNRTNILLALGVVTLGIIVPFLQLILAYIYFKKSHIWSRVLNANLNDRILEGDIGILGGTLNLVTINNLVSNRIMH